MNLFQIATRGIDLDTAPITPDDAPPRAGFQFEAPAAPQQRLRLPTELDEVFALAAAEYDIDPNVLRGVAYAESRFNPDIISGRVKSPAGAIGLMQFMPETAKEYGVEPTDPTQSIIGAAAYLRKSLDKFGGDYERAVASYNWGPNRKAFGSDDWVDKAPEETRKYLGTVFDAAVRFRDGQAERGLPQGVAPSKAGAGRGVVNPGMVNTQEVQAVAPPVDTLDAKLAKQGEFSPLEEGGKGLQSGYTGLKQMWEANKVLKDSVLANSMAQRLSAFDRIDAGATDVPRAIGLAYQQADAAGRAKIRADAQKELSNRQDFIGASMETIRQYQAEQQRTKGRTTDLTDVGNLKDFGNWLAFNGASGVVSMAPLMVASVATGPAAPLVAGVMGYGMATGELAGDRIQNAQGKLSPQRFSRNPDRYDDAVRAENQNVTDYVAKTAGSTVGVAVPFAGLDVALGPVASLLKGAGKEAAWQGVKGATKEIAKDAGEEAVAGGSQEVMKILTENALGEQDGVLTGENLKRVINSAAAEAAGGMVGGAGRVGYQAATRATPTVESQPTTPQAPTVTPQAPVTPDTAKTQAVDNIAAAILEAEGATAPVAPVTPPEKQAASFAQRTATPTPLPGAVPPANAADAVVRSLVDGIKKKRAQDAEETAQIQQMLAEDDAKAEALVASSMEETARGQAEQIAIQARARLVDDLVSSYAEPSEFFASRVLPAVDKQLSVLGRPPLAKEERARVDALLGSTRAFIRPSLPSAPEAPQVLADMGADNAQLESLIKPKKPALSGIGAELAAWKARQQSVKPVQASETPAVAPATQPVTSGLAAEMSALKARSQATTTVDPAKPAPVGIGRDNTPLAEGGKPFKTKAEADTARKLQPMMRVKKQGKGFVLVEKTAAQIAAQEKAARRNLGSVGAGGGPLSAHAFLASQGGLSKSAMADLGFDRNVRVGSKWLFTNTGMTLEGMTEALQQNGYVQGTEQNPAIEMVRRSANGQPQYTAEGWDQIAQAEATARFEDHLAAQQDAMAEDEDFDPFAPDAIAGEFEGDDLVVAGYDAAKDPIKQEVAALLAQLEALGKDTESLRERVAQETSNLSEQDYYERLKQRAIGALNEATGGGSTGNNRGNAGEGRGQEAQPRSGGDRRQDDGREGAPGADGEGLTAYTPEEVTARQDATAQAEATAKRAEEAAARAEAAAKQASEIAQRSVAAADTFELGGNAEDNLSGQEGLKFSFAGARAATAGRMSLMTAQDRIDAGENAEVVRQETGWFKGVDGRWRFEISDNEAKVDATLLTNLARGGFDARPIEFVTYRQEADGTYSLSMSPAKPTRTSDFVSLSGVPESLLPSLLPTQAQEAIQRGDGEADIIGPNLDDAKRVRAPFQFEGFNALPLGVVMDHPKLFAAYPALRDILVQVDGALGNGATFAEMEYVDGTTGKAIKIGNPRAANVDNVLLHEIQHGIQSIEGFAAGGSVKPYQLKKQEASVTYDLMRQTFEQWDAEYRARNGSGERNPAFQYYGDKIIKQRRDEARRAMKTAQRDLNDVGDPLDSYRRLAGEVEARNTQARQGMSDAERRATPPSATADVADSNVVVVMNGREMAMAPMPVNAVSMESLRSQLDALGVAHSISEGNGIITVSKIVVPQGQRNTGIGTQAMQAIVDHADATGQHIALTPSADFGGSKARLTGFYKRFGFKENKGRNRVFSVSESMVRENPNGKTLFSQSQQSPRTPASTIREAITKAYGNLLNRLEGKGLVSLTQTEEEAIAAAAQARADKNGGDVEAIKQAMRASVLASQRGTTTPMPENKAPGPQGDAQQGAVQGNAVARSNMPEERDGFTRMYHAGSDPTKGGYWQTVPIGGVFDGFFALTGEWGAYGTGAEYFSDIPSEKILSSHELEYELDYETVKSVLESVYNFYEDDFDTVWEAVIEDKSHKVDDDDLMRIFRQDSVGEASWEAQRVRGLVAKKLGYQAVEMDDENGTSYLIVSGTPITRVLDENEPSTPTSQGVDIRRSAGGNLEGFFDPATGKSFLIADNLTAESAPGTLMHEVGIHMAADGKLEPLFTRAGNLLKLARKNPFIQRVQARMDQAGETSNEEAAAYIVTEYENDRAAAPDSVVKWVKDFIADVRAWLFGKGVLLKTDQLTVADIAAVARANARGMAKGDGKGDVRYSKQSMPDKRENTETPEFQRWFGDSKVVDADGKPLVVYHGTSNDQQGEAFTMLDAYGSNYGLFGQGAYMTADPAVASEYTTKGRGKSPTVYPLYAAIKNPIDMDAEADPQRWLDAYPDFDVKAYHDGGTSNESYYRAVEEAVRDEGMEKWDGAEAIQDGLRRMGHDGITHIGGGRVKSEGKRHRVFIAFDPEQIKSATGNNGDFDPTNPDIRASRNGGQQTAQQTAQAQPVSKWRDSTGRLQFAPGAMLYDFIGAKASPLLSYMGLKAASPELRTQLRRMKAEVAKAQEVAAKVATESAKFSEAERAMVSDLVEKTVAAGTIPPDHAVKMAELINTVMGKQTDELVALGMMEKDSADRWRGQYLPRYYESKLLKKDAWTEAMTSMMRRASLMRGIKGKHLKGRGLFESVPVEQQADYEALGWEVRDSSFNPENDKTVMMWRDFTSEERANMGEIRDAGFRFVMGYMQTQKDLALGRMYRSIAQDENLSSRTPTDTMTVKVPDTKVKDTAVNVYGELAGRYVSRETLSVLSSQAEAQSDVLAAYRKALGLWKEGKTVLNPVSHLNNVVSNITMAHFAGVSYHRGDKYIAAITDLVKGSAMVKEAKAAGLFSGGFSEAELMQSMPEELKALAGNAESRADKAINTAMRVMTFGLRNKMQNAYGFEDDFFKYLIYKDARSRGTSPDEAIDFAQRYIFTYDDLPKGARIIRDSALPFFSYTYKAVPALLHTALTQPHRFAVPAALTYAAASAAYAIAAGDDDDDWYESIEKYLLDEDFRNKAEAMREDDQKRLPPWMKGCMWTLGGVPRAIRVGYDKELDLPVFFDISRMMPGGTLIDVSPNAGGVPLFEGITPSHPLLSIGTAMLGNRDLFTGKDVVDKTDDRWEAAGKRADWMWKQLSPAITIGNYHYERVMNMVAQQTGEFSVVKDYTGVDRMGMPTLPQYGIPQTFGLKIKPVDLDLSEEISRGQNAKLIREIDAEVRALQRLHSKGNVSAQTMEREREKAAEKKQRLREGLTVDGDKR